MADDLQADVLVDEELFTIIKDDIEKTFRGYEFTYNVLKKISDELDSNGLPVDDPHYGLQRIV